MTLTELHISYLRNIASAKLELDPKINFIMGNNGSGKTSTLEAIHLLTCGHSFRTRDNSLLIKEGEQLLTVFAKTDDNQRVSIQKNLQAGTLAKINAENCLVSSKLAAFMPSQLLYQDIFNFIDAGPSLRRGVLDWGLFHVKHDYLSVWKDYRRVLKQRNQLLKQRASRHELSPWNKMLVELSITLNEMREVHLNNLSTEFNHILKELTHIACEVDYYKGWDRKNEGRCLEDILVSTLERDLSRQFTHYGAHQADILLISNNTKVKNYFSRGQQKVALFALKLAQAKLINKPCIYMIDDLEAELDDLHIEKIMSLITDTPGQFFITTRKPSNLVKNYTAPCKSFLVNEGGFSVV